MCLQDEYDASRPYMCDDVTSWEHIILLESHENGSSRDNDVSNIESFTKESLNSSK